MVYVYVLIELKLKIKIDFLLQKETTENDINYME